MNKFSGWRAGRMDAVSYDGDGDGPYKQVYVDNPNGRFHLGERLPDVVCKAFGVQGADCRDVALMCAAGPDLLEALRLYDVWHNMPVDRGGKSGPKGKAYAAFVAAKDAAMAKAVRVVADDEDDDDTDPNRTDLYTENGGEAGA